MAGAFAIKEALKLKITELGTETPVIEIPFANECELTIEGETTFAKINGADSVGFPGARKGSFTVKAEVADEKYLGMSMGATVTGDTIEVNGTVVNKAYKITGLFNVVMADTNAVVAKEITLFKGSPNPSSTINFSHENVAQFDLKFDLARDSADKFMLWKNATPPTV